MTEQANLPSWTEEERLAALHRTGLLDTSPEQAYDDLVRLAADLVGVPMAAVHLVAEDRQWGKAEIGLGVRNIPRDIAFCPTAMLEPDGLVVPDATKDPRFASNPLVTGRPSIRFYAGVPLSFEGLPMGALCVIDTEPREAGLSERQVFALRVLATQASNQIALRHALVERDRVAAELRVLNETLEQRVAERTADLMMAEDRLHQSQKMEAVGQLTGGLAHDFNNLLTCITGALELLRTRIAQGRMKDVERYVSITQGAAKRAATLTHRLLAFSRQQTLDPRPADMNRLVAGMEELIRRTTGPAIDVEVVGAAGLWPTRVDSNQLENALLNLCINARDAMPSGGRLTIETVNTWLDDQTAMEPGMEPGQYVAISVTDTGTGMSADVIARAFDPFFTTKPLGQGTGLGLSMIYGFARQAGGQVQIQSEVGQGTTMRVYLPRHHGTADVDDALPPLDVVPRAETGQTVLVVDDDATVRMLVTEVLEELGYLVIGVGDGASGLAVLQSETKVDVLVTDLGLPGGMNGREMADAARAKRPVLKVLFITGYAANAAIGNGQLDPGMHVMTKPFAMETLANRINELISGPTAHGFDRGHPDQLGGTVRMSASEYCPSSA